MYKDYKEQQITLENNDCENDWKEFDKRKILERATNIFRK